MAWLSMRVVVKDCERLPGLPANLISQNTEPGPRSRLSPMLPVSQSAVQQDNASATPIAVSGPAFHPPVVMHQP